MNHDYKTRLAHHYQNRHRSNDIMPTYRNTPDHYGWESIVKLPDDQGPGSGMIFTGHGLRKVDSDQLAARAALDFLSPPSVRIFIDYSVLDVSEEEMAGLVEEYPETRCFDPPAECTIAFAIGSVVTNASVVWLVTGNEAFATTCKALVENAGRTFQSFARVSDLLKRKK